MGDLRIAGMLASHRAGHAMYVGDQLGVTKLTTDVARGATGTAASVAMDYDNSEIRSETSRKTNRSSMQKHVV
jgi:hypothetical protein